VGGDLRDLGRESTRLETRRTTMLGVLHVVARAERVRCSAKTNSPSLYPQQPGSRRRGDQKRARRPRTREARRREFPRTRAGPAAAARPNPPPGGGGGAKHQCARARRLLFHNPGVERRATRAARAPQGASSSSASSQASRRQVPALRMSGAARAQPRRRGERHGATLARPTSPPCPASLNPVRAHRAGAMITEIVSQPSLRYPKNGACHSRPPDATGDASHASTRGCRSRNARNQAPAAARLSTR